MFDYRQRTDDVINVAEVGLRVRVVLQGFGTTAVLLKQVQCFELRVELES